MMPADGHEEKIIEIFSAEIIDHGDR